MRLKSGFAVTQEADGYYVARAQGELAREFPQAIQMGLSGAYLWDLLSQGDYSEVELVIRLESLFDTPVDTAQVYADVKMFVDFLRQQGLLEEAV